jgi:phosphoribosylformimino-5-aminoimidazole carboxamide ribotide isomerase
MVPASSRRNFPSVARRRTKAGLLTNTSLMIVIPAIDLKDGRCVRLRQGDMSAETVYSDDAAAVAVGWQARGAGLIHIVDLNGAVAGRPRHIDHVQNILGAVSVKIQVGGGIRDIETIRRYFDLGVWRVVLGTAALRDRQLLQQACQEFPGRIMLGLDAKNGMVAVQGWTAVSDYAAGALLRDLAVVPLGGVIYTDIARDGMLTGPNIQALREVIRQSTCAVIASGGISRIEDLRAVQSLGPRIEGAIVGKALYDGTLDLADAIKAVSGCGSSC